MQSPPCASIGSRRELFVDRELIDELAGVSLRMHAPVNCGRALTFDKPWEGPFSIYASVVKDGDLFRLYYRAQFGRGQESHGSQSTCCAESSDGITWHRPDINLFKVREYGNNNIVIADDSRLSNNFTAFLDAKPGVPAAERLKAVAGFHRAGGLYLLASADGYRWKKLSETPIVPGVPEVIKFDSQNVAFWSEAEGKYLLYYRTTRDFPDGRKVRWVSRAVSDDALHWTTEGEMDYENDFGSLYTNQTAPYFRAPHIYAAIAARFFQGRESVSPEEAGRLGLHNAEVYRHECSDAVLLTSRGGLRYDREFREAFIRPGPGLANWTSRSNYPALNVVQTGPGTMSLYVSRHFAQPTMHLDRYEMRLDGFASAHAGAAGGTLRTKPLAFQGGSLELNFSTSASGGIQVEIQDAAGVPIPGFSFAEAPEMFGDAIGRDYVWPDNARLPSLNGRPVRLCFRLRDADLYSYRFRD